MSPTSSRWSANSASANRRTPAAHPKPGPSSFCAVEEHLQRFVHSEQRFEDLEGGDLEERLLATPLDHPLGLLHLGNGNLPLRRSSRVSVRKPSVAVQVHDVRRAFVLADVIDDPNPTIEPPPGHEACDPPPKPVRGVTRRQYGHHPPGLIEEVEERREEEQVEVLQPHGL